VIDRIALTVKATVLGIEEARFQHLALATKENCPLSKALGSVSEFTLMAMLRRASWDALTGAVVHEF
jgi:osmotically inducible protein OsmC